MSARADVASCGRCERMMEADMLRGREAEASASEEGEGEMSSMEGGSAIFNVGSGSDLVCWDGRVTARLLGSDGRFDSAAAFGRLEGSGQDGGSGLMCQDSI